MNVNGESRNTIELQPVATRISSPTGRERGKRHGVNLLTGSNTEQATNRMVAAGGVLALLISVWSASSSPILGLPSWIALMLAVVGGGLLLVAARRSRRSSPGDPIGTPRPSTTPLSPAPASRRAPAQAAALSSQVLDLPVITEQMGGLLVHLHREHGLAYCSTTWADQILPRYAAAPLDRALARDLLAIAALDAGGVRADVSAIGQTRTQSEVTETNRALLMALERVVAACRESTAGHPPALPPREGSRWSTQIW